jgi:hypothetical protein
MRRSATSRSVPCRALFPAAAPPVPPAPPAPLVASSQLLQVSQVLKNQAMLAMLGITGLVQEHRNQQLPAEKKGKDKMAPATAPTRASARVASMPDRPQYAPEVKPQGGRSRGGRDRDWAMACSPSLIMRVRRRNRAI